MRYLLAELFEDTTMLSGDRSSLLMALLACLLGYGEVGLWLKSSSWVKLKGNPYITWIESYSGNEYQTAVKIGLGDAHNPFCEFLTDFVLIETIEEMALLDPPSRRRFEEWLDIWTRCTKLERNFWDMALRLD